MKTKLINIIVITLSIISLIELLFNRTLVFSTISYSLNLWTTSIIPSLFPFFIISDILIKYNAVNYIPNFIKKYFSKLFNVSDNVFIVFILSMLSGFPSSARCIRTMYDNNMLDEKEASHALIFTHFSNPFFLKNEKLGLIILISHYISNIILGITTRKMTVPSKINQSNLKNNSSINFPKIFISAINNAINTLLMILGTLSCFLVISSLIINKINLDVYTASIFKGILEITMGLESLCSMGIPDIYKVVISTMFISFGGLSVHIQILSFLIDTKISYRQFFIARIFHAIISGIISYLLYIIFI